jgi:hypothetical protein
VNGSGESEQLFRPNRLVPAESQVPSETRDLFLDTINPGDTASNANKRDNLVKECYRMVRIVDTIERYRILFIRIEESPTALFPTTAA